MTAMSWNKSTEKLLCPPSLFISPFSDRVCSTIAVEESESTSPTARATVQPRPNAIPAAVIAATVSPTCRPPSPSSRVRIAQSRCGSSSKPIRNSIITTPNSAKCWMLTTSTSKAARSGLRATPAIR